MGGQKTGLKIFKENLICMHTTMVGVFVPVFKCIYFLLMYEYFVSCRGIMYLNSRRVVVACLDVSHQISPNDVI